MGEAFISRRGGGGAGLNFSVKAYASESVLPSAGKENTIAVIADEINGWIFSATEPANPSEGMVWIPTGTSSTVKFNALKKNGIEVYPQSAKQYTDGEWVQIDAYMDKSGQWVQFSHIVTDVYLYNRGDTCDAVTGGWVGYNGNSTVTNGANSMTVKVVSGYKSGGAKTVNTVDVSKHNTLAFIGSGNDIGDWVIQLTQGGSNVASTTLGSNVTLDISNVSGAVGVELYCADSRSGGRTLVVTEIKLLM